MELAELKPIERTIELKHPVTDEPVGIRIGLVSMDDPSMKAVRRNITDRSQKLAQKNKSFSAEEIEQNSNQILWAASTSWEWYNPSDDPEAMPKFNGEVPEYNQRNFMAFIKDLAWARRQISEEVEETKDFFKV